MNATKTSPTGTWMDDGTERLAKAIEAQHYEIDRCGNIISIPFTKGMSADAFDCIFGMIRDLDQRVVWTVASHAKGDQVLVWLPV